MHRRSDSKRLGSARGKQQLLLIFVLTGLVFLGSIQHSNGFDKDAPINLKKAEPSKGFDLLVVEEAQITKMRKSGEDERVTAGPGPACTLGSDLYVSRKEGVVVYNQHGVAQQTIPLPAEVGEFISFLVLPDKRLAFFDNRNDVIHFTDVTGKLLKTVPINAQPDKHLQNMRGVVVGDRLIVSENGEQALIAVDLDNYQVSLFMNLNQLPGSLGAITYLDGLYYICQKQVIYSLNEKNGQLTNVATIPEGNVTGIVAAQGRLVVVVNGVSQVKERSLAAKRTSNKGAMYGVYLKTGKITQFRNGLNYPSGILLLGDNCDN